MSAKAPEAQNTPPLAVDEHEIARLLGISVISVRRDRYGARSIPFFRVGRAIRYNPEAVLSAFLARQEGCASKRRAAA